MNGFATFVLALIALKCAAQLWLERLNQKHVLTHAERVPDAFAGFVDAPTSAPPGQYTLAKGRFEQVELVWSCLILLVVLFSGILPWGFNWLGQRLGNASWAMAAFLF